jgi:hypothetical protein
MKVGLIALDRDRVYARAHMQPRMDARRRGVRVNPTMEVLMETATEDRLVERAFELARRSASSEESRRARAHRLLLDPGGFEGFGVVPEEFESDDLALVERCRRTSPPNSIEARGLGHARRTSRLRGQRRR